MSVKRRIDGSVNAILQTSALTLKLPAGVTAKIKSAVPLPKTVVFNSNGVVVVGGGSGGQSRVNDLRATRAREGARARSRAPPLFITLRAARSAPATRGGAEAAFRTAGPVVCCENNAHSTDSSANRRQ
ncbi:unnamed protein product [Arctia plantaginis]|uniref:Uncharacterized protein n=1 Tax=Arctia plantaginis TaxID=874455 RepID=A0A8S0YYE1_ARCPL|nr:unnamed protein product [Arctia plantaginis]